VASGGRAFKICKAAQVDVNVAVEPDVAASGVCTRFSALQRSNSELLLRNSECEGSVRQLAESEAVQKSAALGLNYELQSVRDELIQQLARMSELKSTNN
jgi:hypothetical protein